MSSIIVIEGKAYSVSKEKEDNMNKFENLVVSSTVVVALSVLSACSGSSSGDTTLTAKTDAIGVLDTSFNSVGYVVDSNTSGGDSYDEGKAVAIDAQGRIVVTGMSVNDNSNGDMVVWRYNSDGTLDQTFNGTGYVISSDLLGVAEDDEGMAVAVDANGKIVVAGFSNNGSNDDMVIWRYNTDGTVDTSFNNIGYVFHDGAAGGNGYDYANALALDANGKIVVAGVSEDSTGHLEMTIWRYNSDGSLDTTFGGDGNVSHIGAAGGTGSDYGYGVAIDANGKIVVTGSSKNGSGYTDLAIWRYNSDGSLDTSFNGSGHTTRDNIAGGFKNDEGHAVTFQDSKIVVTGFSVNSNDNKDMFICRYLHDGSLDTSYNTTGCGVYDSNTASWNIDEGNAIAIDAKGKIVVAGYSTNSNNDWDMTIWRYNADGTLDTDFNTLGYLLHDGAAGVVGQMDYGYDMLLDSKGRIVVAGSSNVDPGDSNMVVWRYR